MLGARSVFSIVSLTIIFVRYKDEKICIRFRHVVLKKMQKVTTMKLLKIVKSLTMIMKLLATVSLTTVSSLTLVICSSVYKTTLKYTLTRIFNENTFIRRVQSFPENFLNMCVLINKNVIIKIFNKI